jgi:hypothetical protein
MLGKGEQPDVVQVKQDDDGDPNVSRAKLKVGANGETGSEMG